MTKKLAIIGASIVQRPLVLKAIEMGLEVHVFAWQEGNAVEDIACKFYPISITEKEEILKKCSQIGIDGITTIGSDLALDTVNYIASKLSLVGNSMKSTYLTRDKHLMRERLKKENLPIPCFSLIDCQQDFDTLNFGYPFMVKATDRSGSRGIKLVKNKKEAIQAMNEALDVSINKKVIAEEYFEGRQYSLEMLSQDGTHNFIGITEEFFTGPPQFVEKGHLMPGRISEKNLKKAIELSRKALDALEFKFGASHIELRVSEKNKFCFIEIGGRMGGDFRSELVKLSYKYDYTKDVVNIALGCKLEIKKQNPYSFTLVKWVMDGNDMDILNKSSIDIVSSGKLKNPEKKGVSSSDQRLGYIIIEKVKNPDEYLEH